MNNTRLTTFFLLFPIIISLSILPISNSHAEHLKFSNYKIINLSNNNGTSDNPQIATSGNNIYVVWTDNTTGNGDIYFKMSSDNGKTFDGTKNLSNNNGTSDNPQIVTSGNNIYVVWTDNTTGNGDIYFKMSSDNGKTFDGTKNLSQNLDGQANDPEIAIVNTTIYVVWDDDTAINGGIRMKVSTDGGNIFSITKVINQKGDIASGQLDIDVDQTSNQLYITWSTNNNNISEILYRTSSNNGLELSNIKTISSTGIGENINPKIVKTNNGLIFVFWEDNTATLASQVIQSGFIKSRSDNFDIKYKVSSDNGLNFSSLEYLSHNVGDSNDMDVMSMNDNSVYTVWRDTTQKDSNNTAMEVKGLADIRFRMIQTDLQNQTFSINVSNNTGGIADSPKVYGDNQRIAIVWNDLNKLHNSSDIFVTSKNITETKFSPPLNISNNNGNSSKQQIAFSNNQTDIVWKDDTTGNGDIYLWTSMLSPS